MPRSLRSSGPSRRRAVIMSDPSAAGNRYYRARPHHKGGAQTVPTPAGKALVIYNGANDGSRVRPNGTAGCMTPMTTCRKPSASRPRCGEVDYTTPTPRGTCAGLFPQARWNECKRAPCGGRLRGPGPREPGRGAETRMRLSRLGRRPFLSARCSRACDAMRRAEDCRSSSRTRPFRARAPRGSALAPERGRSDGATPNGSAGRDPAAQQAQQCLARTSS